MATEDQTQPVADKPAAEDCSNTTTQLSKRQQKRMAKMERTHQMKKARRQAAKEEKHKALEQKREAIDAMLASMTEEEQQSWRLKNKEKQKQLAIERAAVKAKHQQALSAPQKVVIDLGFTDLMTPGELRSLCQQLSFSYSLAVNRQQQLHLHLLGAQGDLEAALHRQLPGHVHWSVTKSDQEFKEFFKDRLSHLVYLTADSPHELQQLDPAQIYILGGLVDRNRHKGLCLDRALQAGIATARLPISKHFKLHTSAVITVNQCVDILSRMLGQSDWREVLAAVLPTRKRAEAEEEATGGGSSSSEPLQASGGAAAAAVSHCQHQGEQQQLA